jgi:tetratricopeptide (TPR) repeat protein
MKMSNHIFISYSTKDAKDFAIKLCDNLKAGPPSIDAWLDKRKLRAGMKWYAEITEALRTCACLVFVMSRDSVRNGSICIDEWTLALKYKKPVIPILFHEDADLSLCLVNYQYIDFSEDYDRGLKKLREELKLLNSPEGRLNALKYQLKYAERELQYCDSLGKRGRIENEIQRLESDIEELERILTDPEEAKRHAEERRKNRQKKEQKPEMPVRMKTAVRFINSLPCIAPTYFQDRHVETNQISDFLKNDVQRMMMIVGCAGIGKTTMVCRMLEALKNGKLPDDGGYLPLNGIVCLGENSTRKVNFSNLFADLCRLLPDETAKQLNGVYRDPQISTDDKMLQLLSAFPEGRVVVLLDNFETKLDAETRELVDEELYEALKVLLDCPQHAVKVIITTRVVPYNLTLVQPGKQYTLKLDNGLESPYAEDLLRKMDKDGILGLKNAPDDLLDLARKRTKGYPRALEALVALLNADWGTNLQDILSDTEKFLPEHVMEKLVGEAFSRLDSNAQKVMQALAVYSRPVTTEAVDSLLRPFLPGVESEAVLNRLVNMQLVRKEEERYYLHPVDCEYALSRVPKGEEPDRDKTGTPPFTQFFLYHRGADYFKEIRRPQKNLNDIDDLEPQLAEIDLRYAGQEFDTAVWVLLGIDFKYLLLWGPYRLMIEMHQRLQGKIRDPRLQGDSAGNLGSAYRNMGKYQEAISNYDRAIEIARKRKDQWGECVWIGNKGNCYYELGETGRAIDHYEHALDIGRKLDKPGEIAVNRCRLGLCYADMGNGRAIKYYQDALAIYKKEKNSDPRSEAITHGNLGICFAALGRYGLAIDHYRKALDIAEKIGDRATLAVNHGNIGHAYIMKNKFHDAETEYKRSILIADKIGYLQAQNESRCGLALTYLYRGDLDNAHVYVKEALNYNYPKNRHGVQTFLGLLLLRQGDVDQASSAFRTAITEAEKLLDHTGKNYKALDDKGLSLCGLSLCQKDDDYIQQAKEAFRKARTINKAAGHMKQLLDFFDELAKADKKGILKGVREEIANFVDNLRERDKE